MIFECKIGGENTVEKHVDTVEGVCKALEAIVAELRARANNTSHIIESNVFISNPDNDPWEEDYVGWYSLEGK